MAGSLIQKVKTFLGGTAEGSIRSPWFGMGENGGWFTLGYGDDGFQRNLKVTGRTARTIPAAYAAVMANARAVSQCYASHRKVDAKGKHKKVTTSPASRVLRNPNNYETWPQFILNMTAELQFEGAAFAVVVRGKDNKITAMHKCPQRTCFPYIAEDGSIFYSVGANPMTPYSDANYMVPARDVLHLRGECPRHPLIGESPIAAAALAAGVNVTLSESQAAFFSQMSRPSGIISTDSALTKDQMDVLRKAWEEQSSGLAQGKIPILGGGMKFSPLGLNSQDAELIAAQKMTIADIARVFGVPLPVIGEMEGSTMNNVEQLVSLWLSISLGALLENLERSFDKLFQFGDKEYIELDTAALLRTDFKGRIDGLTKAVQGGLFTPNEARGREGLHPVKNGDKPYMQAQMVELGSNPISETPPEPTAPPPDPEVVADKAAQKAVAAVTELIKEFIPATLESTVEPIDDDISTAVAEASILKAMNA